MRCGKGIGDGRREERDRGARVRESFGCCGSGKGGASPVGLMSSGRGKRAEREEEEERAAEPLTLTRCAAERAVESVCACE